MAFNWFITVEGAKAEELSMSGENAGRVLPAAGFWPPGEYFWNGHSVLLPEIMVR